jgi:stringent starvation protein B
MIPSTKPYLIRAIHDWCIDQGYTPYLAAVVDDRTKVPPGYAKDGQIVLNLAPHATHQLLLGNELITFQARFGGVAYGLSIPVGNVVAVYARENGHGMAFELESAEEGGDPGSDAVPDASPGPADEPERPAVDRSHLKVIK